MSKAQLLVDEQVTALSSICELENEVTQAFRSAMLPIAERHLAVAAQSGGASSEKIKITKKPTKRNTKPKEEKIAGKNAYHFFVADKMGEVKAAGIEAKSRMKRIGEMWKSLDDQSRQPYKDMAERFNSYIAIEMRNPDWKERKEDIVAAANTSAKTNCSGDACVDQVNEDNEDALVDDEVQTVETVSNAPDDENDEEEVTVITPPTNQTKVGKAQQVQSIRKRANK